MARGGPLIGVWSRILQRKGSRWLPKGRWRQSEVWDGRTERPKRGAGGEGETRPARGLSELGGAAARDTGMRRRASLGACLAGAAAVATSAPTHSVIDSMQGSGPYPLGGPPRPLRPRLSDSPNSSVEFRPTCAQICVWVFLAFLSGSDKSATGIALS